MSNAWSKSNAVKTLVRAAVVFLVAVSVMASYAQLTGEGATATVLSTVLVNLYIAALVFYGVFFDAMGTRRFRLALYLGVLAWGAQRLFVGDETALTYVLLLGGGALLTRELYFSD